MKKLLALVLALIMVMALAVSAFAAVWVIDEEDEDELIELEHNRIWNQDEDAEPSCIVNYPKDVTLDFLVNLTGVGKDGENLKNLTADGTGIVKDVKIFDLDPEKYDTEKLPRTTIVYYVACKDNGVEKFVKLDEGTVGTAGTSGKMKYTSVEFHKVDTKEAADRFLYSEAKDVAKLIGTEDQTTKYYCKPSTTYKVVELTLEGNTGVAYTEGKLTLKAKNADGDVYTSKITFINDVAIFKYENVKAAAEYKYDLKIFVDDAYSDYLTNKYGYGDDEQEEYELDDHGAVVVPTTAFRAIEGKKLVLVGDDDGDDEDDRVEVTVTIPSVAKAQKGVNFIYDAKFNYVDEDENEHWDLGELWTDIDVKFYGKQVISSDYTIDLAFDIDYFELREYFLKKLEEEDIVTFYVNKDGKAFDKFTVDYMTMTVTCGEETIEKELHDDVEITINGKAGTALGEYTITIKAPAAETEENPNTGAESAVAVIAAMAVVSAVAAAAVTLKK